MSILVQLRNTRPTCRHQSSAPQACCCWRAVWGGALTREALHSIARLCPPAHCIVIPTLLRTAAWMHTLLHTGHTHTTRRPLPHTTHCRWDLHLATSEAIGEAVGSRTTQSQRHRPSPLVYALSSAEIDCLVHATCMPACHRRSCPWGRGGCHGRCMHSSHGVLRLPESLTLTPTAHAQTCRPRMRGGIG